MPASVLVAPEERPAAGFALSRVSAFYAKGTAEQRESAASLGQMLRGLEETPPGAVELEFLTQDAYLLGVRLFYASVELEEYWLDLRARQAREQPIAASEPELDATVRHFFPELTADPAASNFDPVRGLFTDLGFKLDRAVTESTPRARAMYNSDREEMTDRAITGRETNARLRNASSDLPAEETPGVVAVADRSQASTPDWGVDVHTGLSPDEIPAESFRAMTIGSVRLFITNYGGHLAAVSASCTHQQTGLAKGRFTGTVVECPRHGAEFDLRDGTQVCPPFCQRWMDRSGMKGRVLSLLTPHKTGGDLPVHPLRIENGEIVLRI